MEIIYLIFSATSAIFTSIALSLLLPFSHFFPKSTNITINEAQSPVSYYEGVLSHVRRRPLHNSFTYRVRYGLFNLDYPSQSPPDHLSAHRAREIACTSGPVFLLTIPPSVGYVHNPLSLYYCYELDGSNRRHLKKCVAEVTNPPWGERLYFDFDPTLDTVAKAMHVSPFMDMEGIWNMKATSPGDDLFASITIEHPHLGAYFTAKLKAKRVPASMVSDQKLFFWLMPQKVILLVYWQALKLWWKGVPLYQHPRYINEAYREAALLRDQSLRCCKMDSDVRIHGFTWRDAKWPWRK